MVKIERRAALRASARMQSWASSQDACELVGRNIRLAQDAGERSDLELTVNRHYTTFGSAPHDDVGVVRDGRNHARRVNILAGQNLRFTPMYSLCATLIAHRLDYCA